MSKVARMQRHLQNLVDRVWQLIMVMFFMLILSFYGSATIFVSRETDENGCNSPIYHRDITAKLGF